MNTSIMLFLLILFSIINNLTKDPDMSNTVIKETNNTSSESLVLQYLVREPQVKSAKNKAIILLHGVGSNEKDLFSLDSQLPPDLFVIAPRGQFTLGAGRYAWYSVDFSTGKPVYNTEQETSSRKIIIEFIEQVRRKYNLDEIYLGGFSQGAIMSYSVGLTNPLQVQGILALGGRLLEEIKPFVYESRDLQRLKVFIAHGVQDGTLAVHYAREARAYLQTLGVQLSYHEYNLGHQINGEVLHDLSEWIK